MLGASLPSLSVPPFFVISSFSPFNLSSLHTLSKARGHVFVCVARGQAPPTRNVSFTHT